MKAVICMHKRSNTRPVRIGKVRIGAQDKIVIQTMAKSRPKMIAAALREINSYATEGAEIVRFSVLDISDAQAFKTLKEHTDIPLVADIHFDWRLAVAAIEAGADKIRINPGNIGSKDHLRTIIETAKQYGVPIRIGINAGSLDKHCEKQYGKTAKGMVESAKKHVAWFEENAFHDIVLSFKASDVALTIAATRLAASTFNYPLHLGVTEAGPVYQGIIKSSAALGALIHDGIGDTIRISLSGERLEELKACKTLLAAFGLYELPTLIACPGCGRLAYDMEPIIQEMEAYLEKHPTDLKIAIMGCAVNGPGEAKDADIGVAGGKKEALLFIKGQSVRKIPQEAIVPALIAAIETHKK